MVKRKMKKAIRQKQKVKVSQNVKVVIGDIKKKRAVKSSGAKAGAGAKPPMVLNISNPQPYNNMFMEYFKKQLQNQEPIKANTLAQQEALNEREETKASKAGALHRLDQEPNDLARENRRQGEALKTRIQQAQVEKKSQEAQMVASFKKLPKEPQQTQVAPKIKQPAINPPLFQMQQQQAIAESIASNLEQQQTQMESLMNQPFEAMEEEETRLDFPVPATSPSLNLPPPKATNQGGAEEEKSEPAPKKKRGRKPYTEEQKKEASEKQKEKARLKRQAEKIQQARAKAMSPKFPTIV